MKSDIRVRELLQRAAGGTVLVLGAGVTGRSVAKLLARAGYRAVVIDERPLNPDIRAQLRGVGVEIWDSFVVSSEEHQAQLREARAAFAVISPGIALDGKLVSGIGRAGIPRISEIDLAVAYLGMPTIAVTGTNGKTTTVTVIYEMMRRSGIRSALVGNVGAPLVDLIEPHQLTQSGDLPESPLLVCEVSSYQLEAAFDFVPRVGVWLNIDDDHLERHGSLGEYLRIKSRIFSGQNPDTDWSLLWADDPAAMKMKALSRGRYLPFGRYSRERSQEASGCWYDLSSKEISLALPTGSEQYSFARWKLIGEHNLVNLAAAVAAARLGGATPQAVQEVIDSFEALPHRLEPVATVNGVTYVNDSKGTNVSAARVAVETVKESLGSSRLVLLVGGRIKEGSFAPLAEVLFPGTRAVVGFGGDGDRVLASLDPLGAFERRALLGGERPVVERVGGLEEAVHRASQLARPGDIVLLSPGCSSFDSYSDYVERGVHFRRIVTGLKDSSAETSP